MVKNKIGGKKTKKKASKNDDTYTRELILKEQDQFYGKITKVLGSCRFEITGIDDKSYLGIARGVMKNKVWINLDNYVLYTVRDFQENKVDIIHKYNEDEVRQLISMGEILEKNEDTSTNTIEKETSIIFDDI